MRNHRSKTGKNSSLFSQRKFIYNLFKNCNFDENLVLQDIMNRGQGNCTKCLILKVIDLFCHNFSPNLSLLSLLMHLFKLHFPKVLGYDILDYLFRFYDGLLLFEKVF